MACWTSSVLILTPRSSEWLVKANFEAKEKQPHRTHYATALESVFYFANWKLCVSVP